MLIRGLDMEEDSIASTSDGYHTFDELYAHRNVLFIALMKSHPDMSWRSKQNKDGSVWDGWFVAGMELPTGEISYHLPERLWSELDHPQIRTLDVGLWDGHTSDDVVKRLQAWFGLFKERYPM